MFEEIFSAAPTSDGAVFLSFSFSTIRCLSIPADVLRFHSINAIRYTRLELSHQGATRHDAVNLVGSFINLR